MKMINEIVILILALLAGAGLGAVFFGGLWWTIQKGLSSKRPALLFLGSMLLRSSIAVAGFYFVAGGGQLGRILACLLGFVLMKVLIARLARPAEGEITS